MVILNQSIILSHKYLHHPCNLTLTAIASELVGLPLVATFAQVTLIARLKDHVPCLILALTALKGFHRHLVDAIFDHGRLKSYLLLTLRLIILLGVKIAED